MILKSVVMLGAAYVAWRPVSMGLDGGCRIGSDIHHIIPVALGKGLHFRHIYVVESKTWGCSKAATKP